MIGVEVISTKKTSVHIVDVGETRFCGLQAKTIKDDQIESAYWYTVPHVCRNSVLLEPRVHQRSVSSGGL